MDPLAFPLGGKGTYSRIDLGADEENSKVNKKVWMKEESMYFGVR